VNIARDGLKGNTFTGFGTETELKENTWKRL